MSDLSTQADPDNSEPPVETEAAEQEAEAVAADEPDRTLHDPFAPPHGGGWVEPFPADRWTRAGADEEELSKLEQAWLNVVPEGRTALAGRIIRCSDGELTEMLVHQRETGEFVGWEDLSTIRPAAEAEQHEGDGAPTPDTGTSEWREVGAVNIEGTVYRTFKLPDGELAALVGDQETGRHVVAKDMPSLLVAIRDAG